MTFRTTKDTQRDNYAYTFFDMVQARKDSVNVNIESKHMKLLKTSAFGEGFMDLHFYSCRFSVALIFFKIKKNEEGLLPRSPALICYVVILKVSSQS